jgi:carboxypeptidase C (cathepsin A)
VSKFLTCIAALFFLSSAAAVAETPTTTVPSATGASGPTQERSPFALADQVVVNNRSIVINGSTLSYDIRAGALAVSGKNDKETANISYIAYFAHPAAQKPSSRPIAFCFNGGPGSSSVWLHMGFLGPKTIDITGLSHPQLPVQYKDNPQTLLPLCDLVFIDPVSTGFSSAVNKDDTKKFHGVEEDLYSIADFIRLFLTKYNLWDSPKLLIGESYGTLRAVGLASLLQDHYFIDINGLVLISMVLDLQTLSDVASEDIPPITTLPSLAAIAQYHNQLKPPLSNMSVSDLVATARKFALEEYAPALVQGSSLPPNRRGQIQKRLAELTSLPEATLANLSLRVTSSNFFDEFLKDQQLCVGRFDGRASAPRVLDGPSVCRDIMGYPDPSFYTVVGAFTSAFQTYLEQELQWKKGEPYVVLSHNVEPWNWATSSWQSPGMGYISLMRDFRLAMVKNPTLKVFVAAGYYDLATPYLSQEYSLTHLFLPNELQSNVSFKGYEGGHMIYLDPRARPILTNDLNNFISTLTAKKNS